MAIGGLIVVSEKLKNLRAEHHRTRKQLQDILFVDGGNQVRSLNAKEAEAANVLEARLDLSARTIRHMEDVDCDSTGFSANYLKGYNILRALNCRADGRAVDGLEGEVSAELAKRAGKQPNGFYFPMGMVIPIIGTQTRSLNTTTAAGTIQTTVLAAQFIEILRNKTVMNKVGATFLKDLTGGKFSLPKQNAASTAYWVSEETDVTASNPAVTGGVLLAPNTVGVTTAMSRSLMKQNGADVQALVASDLAATLATEIDRAAMNGSGSGAQPTGILQNGSVTTVAGGTNGLALNWANVVAMETGVATANADLANLAYVTNAKVRGALKQTLENTTSAAAQYIWRNDGIAADGTPCGQVNGYNAIASNQLPANLTKGSGSGLSSMIFGNWADLVIALWGAVDINVNPYTLDKQGGIQVTMLQDCDIKLRRTESFQKMIDIIAQ